MTQEPAERVSHWITQREFHVGITLDSFTLESGGNISSQILEKESVLAGIKAEFRARIRPPPPPQKKKKYIYHGNRQVQLQSTISNVRVSRFGLALRR